LERETIFAVGEDDDEKWSDDEGNEDEQLVNKKST
jgi:hypothetical protein